MCEACDALEKVRDLAMELELRRNEFRTMIAIGKYGEADQAKNEVLRLNAELLAAEHSFIIKAKNVKERVMGEASRGGSTTRLC